MTDPFKDAVDAIRDMIHAAVYDPESETCEGRDASKRLEEALRRISNGISDQAPRCARKAQHHARPNIPRHPAGHLP